MAAAAILDFFKPDIEPLDPPSPKMPATSESNMKWIGRLVAVLAHTDLVFYDILKKMKPSDNLYHVILFQTVTSKY